MKVVIRTTTKVECPCGATYRYPDVDRDEVLYQIWTDNHRAHWKTP